MKITDILSPEMVVPELKGNDKPSVLKELASCLCARYTEIRIADLTAVLEERERLGSTAIGDGIAIPHGKLAGVKGILGVFGRHRAGVDFDSLDGKPTQLFFCWSPPRIPPACISRRSRGSRGCSRISRFASACSTPPM